MTCESHWMVDTCVTRATEKSTGFHFSGFPLHTEWKSDFSPDGQALLELAFPPFLQLHLVSLSSSHRSLQLYWATSSSWTKAECLFAFCLQLLPPGLCGFLPFFPYSLSSSGHSFREIPSLTIHLKVGSVF